MEYGYDENNKYNRYDIYSESAKKNKLKIIKYKQNNAEKNDLSKIINSCCSCGKNLLLKKLPHILLEPCDHIMHKKCYLGKKICPICNNKIKSIKTLDEVKELSKNNSIYYQKYIDMVSISNFDDMFSVNKELMVPNMIDFLGILSSVPFLSGYDDGQKAAHELLCLMNAKVIVNGMDNIKKGKPVVYISTHTTYLDFVVLFYILRCGFLSSTFIKETWYGRMILNIIPLLLIKRAKKPKISSSNKSVDTNNTDNTNNTNNTNDTHSSSSSSSSTSSLSTVEQMKRYVKKHGSICLFPEGMISHPDTIVRFRTGAFYVGYPVQPIVIKYEPVIYDNDIDTMIKKLLSSDNLTITLHILPQQLPPFDDKKIENIRELMGKTGNIALSRVSNKDINDKEVPNKNNKNNI
ncbi:MAG: lysophospholipid acyltransferase [Terrestrivirus sp.]|uniref:Lysophospholipid acyltransferase n=1 Tax=Terrestrivirus sp. TaxID=2487775 RepID=A0A3G4ZNM4_9VIRU|nr:MAG: lysophospholipid acyltransferase [Terrestrivirus sp.]